MPAGGGTGRTLGGGGDRHVFDEQDPVFGDENDQALEWVEDPNLPRCDEFGIVSLHGERPPADDLDPRRVGSLDDTLDGGPVDRNGSTNHRTMIL